MDRDLLDSLTILVKCSAGDIGIIRFASDGSRLISPSPVNERYTELVNSPLEKVNVALPVDSLVTDLAPP